MLTLTDKRSSAVVTPEHGGSLLGWLRDGVPMLRRAAPAAVLGDAHAMGCFPLLPYANRVAGARFDWQGTTYHLARNFGDRPHSIHGLGRERAWTLAGVAPSAVSLTLAHDPDAAWPFAFESTLSYALSEGALVVTMTLTNRHAATAPAGFGIHPYFPRSPGATLQFHADDVWQNDRQSLPVSHGAIPADWSHEQPRDVAGVPLDNCFTGWDGVAIIAAGPASLRIEASSVFRNLQVFTPAAAAAFAVEPVSHAPDALNRPDLPSAQAMRALAPGETLRGTIRLIPTG